MLAVALAVALVAYNLVTNRAPSRESTYLLRNLVTGAVLVGVARWAGISWDELGLAGDELADGWRWGRLVVLAVAVGTAVVGVLRDRVAAVRRALDDQRADLPPARLAFQAFVRIPLGTAGFEELAFRGVLLAAFDQALPVTWAVGAQAVVFGLWHVGPTRLTARLNDRTDPDTVRREVAVAVVGSAVGGVGFALLRLGSGSLLAPILAHASINAFGLLLAAGVHRR